MKIAEVKQVLSDLHVFPKSSRGQNFMIDSNQVNSIARLARDAGMTYVVEVGPGLGHLTEALLNHGMYVYGIEIEKAFVDYLKSLDFPNLEVMHLDASKLDWSNFVRRLSPTPNGLCSNLPYNIGTMIILDILEKVPQIKTIVATLQLDVAKKLCAHPGDSNYGLTSMKLAVFADAKLVKVLKPEIFLPRPKVDSAVILIKRKVNVELDIQDYLTLKPYMHKAFQNRRKMLRKSLPNIFDNNLSPMARDMATKRPEILTAKDLWCVIKPKIAK